MTRMAGRGAKRLKTDAFKVFETNVNRARAFIRVFDGEATRNQGAPTRDERELLRGALVFAIGALDNLMTEMILELVPKFGGNSEAMRQPLNEIGKAEPALALRLAMTTRANAQEEFRTALGNWLDTKTFHGVAKVMTGLSYIGVTIDETPIPADWKKSLEEFTQRRHQIVHRGDKRVVKRDQAQQCADLIESIGQAINRTAVRLYH
jgi:hypothetical protein